MAKEYVFDKPDALRFMEARQRTLKPVLLQLRERIGIHSVADVGCGVGYFSRFVADLGFEIVGFDGRAGNVDEAKRRHGTIEFVHANVEEEFILQRGTFDLVLCLGLLYHLENPLQALRNLSKLTAKALVIESFVIPERGTVFHLRDEPVVENQSLMYISLFPSEGSLIKFCYRIGFAFVYAFKPLPDHEDFHEHPLRRRLRTMLLASRVPLDLPSLEWAPEPTDGRDPWETPLGKAHRYWVFAKSVVAGTAAGKIIRSAKRVLHRSS